MQSIPLGTYDYTHMNHSEPPRVQLCYSYYTVKGKESNPFALTDPVVGGCGRIPFEGIFEVVENLSYLAKSVHGQDWFCSMKMFGNTNSLTQKTIMLYNICDIPLSGNN